MPYGVLIGILGLVAIAACWGLAVVLFRVSTTGAAARKLAVLLLIEGFVLASGGFPEFAFGIPDSFYEERPTLLFILSAVHHLGDAAMIALYPPFLALALNSKLTRPFSRKPVRLALAVGSALLGLVVAFHMTRSWMTLLYSLVTLLFMYALVASINAWRTAQIGVVRQRAGIFALAFGLRDIGWGLSYGIAAWLIWTQPLFAEMSGLAWLGKLVYALGSLVAVPLITYGVLRAQLFDIDLRIRWTIKQSTLAAIAVTIVFLVSEGAERFLSAELGSIFGLLAAAAVVFFLAPLQSFAERVASAAMPNTHNTPEYAAHRKMQVYEAALAEAQQDGGITEKERLLLNRLRQSLGISPTDAESLERELPADSNTF